MKVEVRWSPAGDYVWVFNWGRHNYPIFGGTPQEFALWALCEKYHDNVINTKGHYDEEA